MTRLSKEPTNLRNMKKLIQPFATINRQTFMIMVAVQVVITLLLWQVLSDGLIPKPGKIASAGQQDIARQRTGKPVAYAESHAVFNPDHPGVCLFICTSLFRKRSPVHSEMPVFNLNRFDIHFHPAYQRWQPVKIIITGIRHRALFCNLLPVGYHKYQQAGI
jgi:hypothetical protein